jgi:hypothetical protein
MRLPSLWGWLDIFGFWRRLDYPKKGAILRALKAGASSIVGVILAATTEGNFLPEGSGNFVIVFVTLTLQALDKFIRELEVAGEEVPTNDTIPVEDPDEGLPTDNPTP